MRRDLTGSKRWHISGYDLIAMMKEQEEKPEQRFRVYDEVGRPTHFVGTLNECNATFGDKDVTYVPVQGEHK